MNIEDIIPNVELCKLIPDGEFSDCVFVWVHDSFNLYPAARELVAKDYPGRIYPAPTVTEILKVLWNDYQKPTVYFRNSWYVTIANDYGDEITAVDNENAANAALKLWLTSKGIE